MNHSISARFGSLSRLFASWAFVAALVLPGSALAQIDLVFLIDGSASIDAVDFQIQKQGIIQALRNRALVPRDGTVQVGAVQFAEFSRMEIPMTQIFGLGDVNALSAQVNAISQITGMTFPAEGVDISDMLLNGAGFPEARQILCMSTDGLPSPGANSVAAAIAGAQASVIGLDKFGVLAIEDPPFVFEPDFIGFYGPLVFGGGGVTVVRDSAEFANVIGPTCFESGVRLVGLEAVQSIQDLNDSIWMIENKPTIVRAYLEPTDGGSTATTARLRGFRGGVELGGSPLNPINPTSTVLARDGAISRRGAFEDSLNFRLPPDWRTGTVELMVEGVGGGLVCLDNVDTPEDCAVTVTFEDVPQPPIMIVGINYSDGFASFSLTDDQLLGLSNRTQAMFPVDGIDLHTRQLDWPLTGPPNVNQVTAVMRALRFYDGCWDSMGCNTHYYGAIPGDMISGVAAGIPAGASSGYVPMSAFAEGRQTHSHEMGHGIGRHHAPFCGAVVGPGAPTFPNTAMIDGREVATIGPLDAGDEAKVYGLDINALDSGTFTGSPVVDPHKVFELMSYCSDDPFDLWISDFTYMGVKETLGEGGGFISDPGGPRQIPAGDDFMIVRGMVDTEAGTAEFDSFGTINSSVAPDTQPSGDYTLELTGSGRTVSEITFEPTMHEARDGTSTVGSFIIPVPAGGGVSGAKVMLDGEELAAVTASANPPSVMVTSPNGGENLTSDTVNILWAANDTDGDDLTYFVQYSADGGASFETLAGDVPAKMLEVPRSALRSTNEGVIRVIASDGFHATVDDSDAVFSVANNAPLANIKAPFSGQFFSGGQSVTLSGQALDTEDGLLGDARLSWSSDLDGPLGTGQELVVVASNLTEGLHLITLTATDSGGATDQRQISLRILRLAPLVCPGACGDTNSDGRILAGDALFVLRSSVQIEFCDICICDANGDGRILAGDALTILQLAVDIDVDLLCPLPIPTTTSTTTTSSTTTTTLSVPAEVRFRNELTCMGANDTVTMTANGKVFESFTGVTTDYQDVPRAAMGPFTFDFANPLCATINGPFTVPLNSGRRHLLRIFMDNGMITIGLADEGSSRGADGPGALGPEIGHPILPDKR